MKLRRMKYEHIIEQLMVALELLTCSVTCLVSLNCHLDLLIITFSM